MDKNLEQRVGNHRCQANVDKSKMSGGERFISGILENEGLNYKYEPRLCAEKTYNTPRGEKNYLRLYYPDFSIEDHGFMIEYIGKPDDPGYMAGVEEKRKVYEEMGIPVLYIQRDDVYRKVGEDKFVKREDAYNNVRWKILYMAQKIRSQGIEESQINAHKVKDYKYKSRDAA